MEQLNLEGKTKTEISIEFIREYEPPEGYFLGFSGGKDSIVLEHLTRQSGVSYSVFYSLMHDTPEVIKFVKSRNFQINIIKPKFNFWQGIIKKHPPHRKSRWCCGELKEQPSWQIPLTHRLFGIRAEESHSRAKRGMINYRAKKRIHYNPIFDWQEWEIWDYIESNNLEYPTLYDEGFSRLGCVVCPLRSLKETMMYKARWPQYYRLFENKCRKWWDLKGSERQKERGYNTFEDFMNQWYLDLH